MSIRKKMSIHLVSYKIETRKKKNVLNAISLNDLRKGESKFATKNRMSQTAKQQNINIIKKIL